ncbi:MAG: hypothetical protein AB7S38_28900 [Vulcanimicrobiota bacterium]
MAFDCGDITPPADPSIGMGHPTSDDKWNYLNLGSKSERAAELLIGNPTRRQAHANFAGFFEVASFAIRSLPDEGPPRLKGTITTSDGMTYEIEGVVVGSVKRGWQDLPLCGPSLMAPGLPLEVEMRVLHAQVTAIAPGSIEVEAPKPEPETLTCLSCNYPFVFERDEHDFLTRSLHNEATAFNDSECLCDNCANRLRPSKPSEDSPDVVTTITYPDGRVIEARGKADVAQVIMTERHFEVGLPKRLTAREVSTRVHLSFDADAANIDFPKQEPADVSLECVSCHHSFSFKERHDGRVYADGWSGNCVVTSDGDAVGCLCESCRLQFRDSPKPSRPVNSRPFESVSLPAGLVEASLVNPDGSIAKLTGDVRSWHMRQSDSAFPTATIEVNNPQWVREEYQPSLNADTADKLFRAGIIKFDRWAEAAASLKAGIGQELLPSLRCATESAKRFSEALRNLPPQSFLWVQDYPELHLVTDEDALIRLDADPHDAALVLRSEERYVLSPERLWWPANKRLQPIPGRGYRPTDPGPEPIDKPRRERGPRRLTWALIGVAAAEAVAAWWWALQ